MIDWFYANSCKLTGGKKLFLLVIAYDRDDHPKNIRSAYRGAQPAGAAQIK